MKNDEINRKDKIIEYADKVKHKIEITYPKQNVKNMIESWRKNVKEYKKWLEEYEMNLEKTKQTAINQFRENVEKLKKEIEAFDKLSDEDRIKKLLEIYEKQREEKIEYIKNADNEEQKLVDDIVKKFSEMKKEAENRVKMFEDALELWTKNLENKE